MLLRLFLVLMFCCDKEVSASADFSILSFIEKKIARINVQKI